MAMGAAITIAGTVRPALLAADIFDAATQWMNTKQKHRMPGAGQMAVQHKIQAADPGRWYQLQLR
jgi:hypothetical protein